MRTRDLQSLSRPVLLAAAGLASGLLIARAPVEYVAAALVAGGFGYVALRQPLVALAAALVIGPAKALIGASLPGVPADWGQVVFAGALAVWLARSAAQREIRLHLDPPLPMVLAYAGVAGLSLLGASDLASGLTELAKWAQMVLVAIIVIAECRAGRAGWAVLAVLLGGMLQAGLGIWQFGLRGTGPETFSILGRYYRAYGTFEQPNPFGGYLGMLWPIAAGLALGLTVDLWRRRTEGDRRRAMRDWATGGILAGAALLMLAALVVSFSRGAWLGAAAAALSLLLFLPRRRLAGAGLVVGALLATFVLYRTGLMPEAIRGRLADVGDFLQVTDVRGVDINDANFALVERLAHWQAAVGMAEAAPWLGVGLGNYEAAYERFRLINWPLALGHAHNIYLNTLAETGALGLVTYVGLWGWAFLITIRAVRRQAGWRRGLALGLLGALAHFSAHNIVDNLLVNNVHLTVGALLGLTAWLNGGAAQEES